MITQNNKNQSQIRKNLTSILGLTETEEKLTVKNSERILCSNGSFYFGGTDPQTGQDGGCGCNDHPNNPGGGGSGGDGGGSGGDGGGGSSVICDEEEIRSGSSACTLNGYDCETGQGVSLDRSGNGDGACDDCSGDGNGKFVYQYYFSNGISEEVVINTKTMCGSIDTAKSLFNAGRGKVDSNVAVCGEKNVIADIDTLEYSETRGLIGQLVYRVQGRQCNGKIIYTIVSVNGQNFCDGTEPCANSKNYFTKNGKIYNACDPYGEPPQDCIDMCDSQGNKYRVCGNGNITKLS